jgi:hypothetical protein
MALLMLTTVLRRASAPQTHLVELPGGVAEAMDRVAQSIDDQMSIACRELWSHAPDVHGEVATSAGDFIVNGAHVVTARPASKREFYSVRDRLADPRDEHFVRTSP